MQSSEVISVNIWQILISLCNLLLLFLILKKFLYNTVKKTLAQRQQMIDERLDSAKKAEISALESKEAYEKKLQGAQSEADKILKDARAKAEFSSNSILSAAKTKSDDMIKQAEREVELEKKKASADIRSEIVDISAVLTEKILEREINADDHKDFIYSFIDKIGDEYEGNK